MPDKWRIGVSVILDILASDDVLVLNNSRVIPARLRGFNSKSGGQFEILLLEENGVNDWWVMLRPGKRARVGTEIILSDRAGKSTDTRATVIGTNEDGHRRLQFSGVKNISATNSICSEKFLLPPYITRENSGELADRQCSLSNRLRGVRTAPSGRPRRQPDCTFHGKVAGGNSRARRAGLLCDPARRPRHLSRPS